MTRPLDPTAVRAQFPGLDQNLNYEMGSAIGTAYNTYKAADRNASDAVRAYRENANVLKKSKPYDISDPPVGRPVDGKRFNPAGHEALAPFAEDCAEKANL